MRARNKLFMFGITILLLVLPACDWFRKTTTRETIFDKVVNIPKELVLDIPKLPPLCDELPGLKKGFADILNGKLYYEEEGQGIPLVLINGGPGGTHHGFHPYFSRIKDSAHIIYYDQRGTGKSSSDDTGKTYTVKQAVEDLESLRQALKIDRWAVLGWSYGGLLAQCYALTYPQNCMGLILGASTTGIFDNLIKPVRGLMFISQAEQDSIENIGGSEGKLTSNAQVIYNKLLAGDWKRYFYFKPTNEEIIRKALYEWSPAPGFEELMRPESDNMIIISFLKGKFDDFEIPTLIAEAKWELVWYKPDRIEDMRKNHPHAQLEIFEKSGHMIFVDEPEKFFDILQKFLEKSSKAHIVYKPGNRLAWPIYKPGNRLTYPQQQSSLLDRVKIAQSTPSKSEREKLILACYEQALKENTMDSEVWTRLAYDFIHAKKDYAKCLTVLQNLEIAQKTSAIEYWQKLGYCIKAWQGHILDLLGKRNEAIRCYQMALETNNGRSDNYFDGCMQINKQWLNERLKSPFTWEIFKKALAK